MKLIIQYFDIDGEQVAEDSFESKCEGYGDAVEDAGIFAEKQKNDYSADYYNIV